MPPPRRRPGRNPQPSLKIRPAQVLAVVVVLAVFIAGVVVAGPIGAFLVGLVTLAAGVLLALRWQALDERVRLFRAVVVLAGIAVTISLLYR